MVSKCRSPAVGCTVNLSMFSRSGYRVAMIHAVQCTSRSSWRRPACEALGRVLFAIRGSFTMPPPWLHESNQEWLKGGAPDPLHMIGRPALHVEAPVKFEAALISEQVPRVLVQRMPLV